MTDIHHTLKGIYTVRYDRLLILETCLIPSGICGHKIAHIIVWGCGKDILGYYSMLQLHKCTENSTKYSCCRTLDRLHGIQLVRCHQRHPALAPRSTCFIPLPIDDKYQTISSLHSRAFLIPAFTYSDQLIGILVSCSLFDTLMYPIAIRSMSTAICVFSARYHSALIFAPCQREYAIFRAVSNTK